MSKTILQKEDIILNCHADNPEEAILMAGKKLEERGCITEKYIRGMLQRDKELSVYIGNYLAIAHGEVAVKNEIIRNGMNVMIYPDGIDWHGSEVKVVIGLAACSDTHLEILSNCALLFDDMDRVDKLVSCTDVDLIYDMFMHQA